MMRWNTFAGTLVFAAVAAAGLVPAVLALTPWPGAHTGLGLYLVAVAAVYLRGLVSGDTRRQAVCAATLAIGLIATACLRSVGDIAVVLAVVLAVVRSGAIFGARRTRALLVEAALVGGGLLFARSVGPGTPAGWALSLWSFLLVQSVYFLLARVPAPVAGRTQEDAFSAAYERALALLERREV